MKIGPDDCLSCGVCCVALHDQEAYCDVTVEDLRKLNRSWIRRNVMFSTLFDRVISGGELPLAAIKTKWRKQTKGPFKGVEACQCVALRGDLMHKTKCAIYDKRPRTCREAVKPGDRACIDARRMFLEATDDD